MILFLYLTLQIRIVLCFQIVRNASQMSVLNAMMVIGNKWSQETVFYQVINVLKVVLSVHQMNALLANKDILLKDFHHVDSVLLII